MASGHVHTEYEVLCIMSRRALPASSPDALLTVPTPRLGANIVWTRSYPLPTIVLPRRHLLFPPVLVH